jgi:hypothetical protein
MALEPLECSQQRLWFKNLAEAFGAGSALELTQRLREGGRILSTNDLSGSEISIARLEKRIKRKLRGHRHSR